MFYNDPTVKYDLADNAQFKYVYDRDKSYITKDTIFNDDPKKQSRVSYTTNARPVRTDNRLFASSNTLNVTMADSSIFDLVAAGNYPFSNGSINITSVDSGKISFNNTDPTKAALAISSLSITSNTANNTIYNFKKIGLGTGLPVINEFVLPYVQNKQGTVKMISGFSNYNSLIFEPAVTVN